MDRSAATCVFILLNALHDPAARADEFVPGAEQPPGEQSAPNLAAGLEGAAALDARRAPDDASTLRSPTHQPQTERGAPPLGDERTLASPSGDLNSPASGAAPPAMVERSLRGPRADALAPGARTPTLEEKLLLRQEWVRMRERERAEIRLGGPITGLLLGATAFGASALLFNQGDFARRTGLGLGIVVGLPVTALSAAILGKRVRQRRAITRDIWGEPH